MAKIDVTTRNLMLDSLRQYAKNNISFNFLREHDEKNEIPLSLIKDMYDPNVLGVHLLLIPIEYGGLAGSTTDIYRICEELARIDLGIGTSVFATFLGSDPLNVGGTQEQKAKWFGKIASEQLLVAYGATEADAGSDLVSLRTRAEHVVENGVLKGYKITGSKMWISNGGVADIYTVLAIAPAARHGLLWRRAHPVLPRTRTKISTASGCQTQQAFPLTKFLYLSKTLSVLKKAKGYYRRRPYSATPV
ncbi:alkylation response protein AidB-like acyl-CoA dehydrogenase [Elusimicrobium simillimum]|uniref:acyl-CoA dehydrogenase family protein n=1 Tax=Elusimicrobium simillimum TaxID=3143438 RepID=UPI003C70175F